MLGGRGRDAAAGDVPADRLREVVDAGPLADEGDGHVAAGALGGGLVGPVAADEGGARGRAAQNKDVVVAAGGVLGEFLDRLGGEFEALGVVGTALDGLLGSCPVRAGLRA